MPTSINRIAALVLAAFALLAGALGLWTANGASLAAREDNPRRILAEQRILRGAILDRHGQAIVETAGQPGTYTRNARYPNAAPFTGYYSINYGTSGVEQAFDAVLRGTLGRDPVQAQIDDLLHISPHGRDVQLTIDLDVQRLADAQLGEHVGAIVVLSVPDSDILALSSHPTFDPNMLDANWDTLRADSQSPLLNRAAQGQYQPGTALQPVLLSEAIRRGAVRVDATPQFPTADFTIDARALTCLDSGAVVTLADAFQAACPSPFADLGPALGSEALWEMAGSWGLTGTQVLGIQSRPLLTQTTPLTDTQALREFAAGQGNLTVSPLQMATVASTLATLGEMRQPRIVSATQAIDGMWEPIDPSPPRRVAAGDALQEVVAAMSRDRRAVWHAGAGLSGPSTLLWFIGFAPEHDPRYAIAVLIEAGDDTAESAAIAIGRQVLTALPD